MSHDSIRNKKLVQFPNGKMMLFAEVSCSNVTGWDGKRVWDKHLFHPKGSLFFTKESLKEAQNKYVEKQLDWLRSYGKERVEKGWSTTYEEPTLDSYDYCGTVFPGGGRIRNGKAFFSGRCPQKTEEFFSGWDAPKTITFSCYDKDFHRTYEETFDILRADLDECYTDAIKANSPIDVYISIH